MLVLSRKPGEKLIIDDNITLTVLEVTGNRIAFTHPLLRSAVATRSPPAQRRALHARLAAVVPRREEQARHLALATPQPNGEVAAVVEAHSGQVSVDSRPGFTQFSVVLPLAPTGWEYVGQVASG